MRKRNQFDLSAEIEGIAMTLCGLANQLGEECGHLTADAFQTILIGLSSYLGRIADDVGELKIVPAKK